MFKMRRNFWNLIGYSFSVVVGYAIVGWMTQQLDLLASPLIWKYAMDDRFWFPLPLSGWYGWFWLVPDAYVRFLMLIHVGYWVSVVGVTLSIWFWEED